MCRLIYILFIYLCCNHFSYGQINRYYYGIRVGSIVSFLSGIDGHLFISQRRNTVKDLNQGSASAYGGVFPFIGGSGGVFGGFYFHKKFMADLSMTYSIKGYQDVFEFRTTDTLYRNVDQLNAHYVDIALKVRYINRNFIINLGLLTGANLLDRVYHNMDMTVLGVTTSEEKTYYMHEFFGPYRKPFVTGFLWGIGLRIRKVTVLANVEKTGNIFFQSETEYKFTSFQLSIEYRLNRIDKRLKRLQ